MFLYVVEPIDQWSGWHKPDDLFRPNTGTPLDDVHSAEDWPPLWERAQRLGTAAGWEGDIRTGPLVTVLPNRPGNYYPGSVVIGWKQDNNGTTFIASENFKLPWLGVPEGEG